MIRTARIVSDESGENEVGLNNVVEVYFEDDDETETYKLVTTIRGNSLAGMISIDSPLGRAIVHHRVNDRVYVKIDEKRGYYVVIRSIDKSVGDEEDRIRKF